MQEIEYLDVEHINELPPPQPGFRYFDFLGGTKSLRCFIVPQDMPRNQFISENEDLLDPCLKPIYKKDGIVVSQDSSYPVPGFYIVSPVKHFRSLDEVDETTHLRMCSLIRWIRKAMREVLGIEYVHVYYEEKANKSCNVHYWILPIHDISKHPRLYNFNIFNYLEQFDYKENREKIIEFNSKMKKHLFT